MSARRQRWIQSAEKLVRRGRLEAAISEYRKVLAETPDDTRVLNRVGDLFVRLDRMDEAVDLFRRAAAHFSREGFFVKAIAIYKKIIRVDPTRIQVYEALADLYHRQGLINEARSQYQVVADYHGQRGEVDSVVAIFGKLVELEPDNPSHRVQLAELLIEQSRVAEAMEQYRGIAQLMITHGKLDKAAKVYRRALEVDAGDLGFITDAVLELQERGSPELAEELLATAEARNPKAARVRGLTGLGAGRDSDAAPPPSAAPFAEAPASEAPASEAPASEAPASDVPVLETPAPEAPAPEPAPEAAAGAGPEEVEPEAGGGDAPRPEPAAETPEGTPVLDLDLDEPLPFAVSPVAESAPEPFGEEPLPTTASDAPPRAGEAIEFEIDLDELVAEPEPAAGAPAVADAEEPSREAAEAPPEAAAAAPVNLAERLEELLAEARVLAAYGLADKAVERFGEVLELRPDHLETLARLAELELAEGRPGAAAELAARAEASAAEGAESAEWERVRPLLETAGLRSPEGRWSAPEEAPAAAVAEPAGAPEGAADETREPEIVLSPEAPTTDDLLPAEAPPIEELLPPEESAVRWLDEIVGATSPEQRPEEELFGAEEDFFDLAAELEEELREAEVVTGAEETVASEPEQSLAEIVEGFKRGVSETLSLEDYDTHYNLGIAYREMGLLDEAIGEFQLAAKDPRYLVDCCALLGTCFLEKGFGDLAVKWYHRGLESPYITEEEKLGLLYELGNLNLALGERKAAREAFVEIYGLNSNYRDIVAKLEEVRERE